MATLTLEPLTIAVFIAFFVVFVFLGFYGAHWRRGNLNQLADWALAGRNLGSTLAFFLVGADLYTAYTFVAVPSGIFGTGSVYFFAVPYAAIAFGIALVFAPRLWVVSKAKGYVTGSDFVRDRFNSRTLSILVAIVGIVGMLPYLALQIVGMQSVLSVIFIADGIGSGTFAQEISLIIAFIVLAAFTYTSGLRGATLTAVFKDVLIWVTVIAIIFAALLALPGGSLATAFATAKSHAATGENWITLPPTLVQGYMTLALGSALALYLYPHAVNGILSAQSAHKLRVSTSLLPLYGLGLAPLALLGIFAYSFPETLSFLTTNFPASCGCRGIEVVPTLIINLLPGWLAGIALLGVFVGGLVPAAIMAIAQANLLSRNVIKEFRPGLTEKGEVRIAKWGSAAFKFIALGFVLLVANSLTYAVQLQLLGGILIIQLLPSLFLGLYTTWLKKEALILGLLGGLVSGVYLALAANHYGTSQFVGIRTSFYSILGSNLLYIAILALGINFAITLILSALISRAGATTFQNRGQRS